MLLIKNRKIVIICIFNFLQDHKNFVNVCRFSPDGSKYVTSGSDGKAFVYDGKTGELLGEMNEPAGKIHKGGVYGVSLFLSLPSFIFWSFFNYFS